MSALRRALELSAQRRRRDPGARDLLEEVRKDARFEKIRATEEFNNLVLEQPNR